MTAPPLPEPVLVDRVMTADDATLLVGAEVDPLPANVTRATVALDRETREPVYAYLPLGDVADLREAVRGISYSEAMRAATGLRNRSRVFGYAPRRPVRLLENCNDTSLARERPEVTAVLDAWAGRLRGLLAQIDPQLVDDGDRELSVVLPDWRLDSGRSFWTSGIINRTSQLPYHRDGFNFPTWSAMPVVRRGIEGGHLNLPEYGATIACRDGWGVFFGGWQLVHGVTPMRQTTPDGYRYSVVYYSLRGLKDCATAAVETRQAWATRTERERRQAALVRDRITPPPPSRSTTAADLTLPSEAEVKAYPPGIR
jgi:hypothetical protein